VRWTKFDAFAVRLKNGATLLLSPNGNEGTPTRVHIDEIHVPDLLQRRGAGTVAMQALCRLADKYHFTLEGGPIGWSCDPWRDQFVNWALSNGFEPDQSPFLVPVDDPKAFYVSRQPRL